MIRSVLALLVLAACGGDAEETDLTACQGAGDPVLELGDGGLDGFEPWTDGVTVPIVQNGDRWGFEVEILTEGVDTTADVTSFVRYSLGPSSETVDAGATLTLQCPEEGPGWYGLFVPLDDEHQDEAAAAALAGTDVHLTGTVTDVAGDTASDEVDGVLGAP
jgi:hypothetical protein